MVYVIRRIPDGKYVAKSDGGKDSYTWDVRRVRFFKSKSVAEAHRCPDNEFVEEVKA